MTKEEFDALTEEQRTQLAEKVAELRKRMLDATSGMLAVSCMVLRGDARSQAIRNIFETTDKVMEALGVPSSHPVDELIADYEKQFSESEFPKTAEAE